MLLKMFPWKHLMTVWRSTKWRCDDAPTNRNQMFPLFCRSDDKRDVRDVLWLKSGSVHARCQVKYCKYWLLYCPLFSKESYSSLERMFSLRLQFRQSSLLSLKLYLKGEIGNFTNTPRSFPVKGNNISICKRILIASCFSIKDSIWQCWLVTAVKLWSIICRTWFTVLLHHMRRTSVTLWQSK